MTKFEQLAQKSARETDPDMRHDERGHTETVSDAIIDAGRKLAWKAIEVALLEQPGARFRGADIERILRAAEDVV